MQHFVWTVLVVNWLFVAVSNGKAIDRCEFVHELKQYRPEIDYEELNAWTCIAQYQSNFNTSLRNTDETGAFHGIFQISDAYWCSSEANVERVCNIHCDQLHDTYLNDDFRCIQTIYSHHLKIHGDGFSAWPIHKHYCSDGLDLIKDCLGENQINHNENKNLAKRVEEKKNHKIFERCELARQLLFLHDLPYEQIATWVCIAKHESNYNTSATGHQNADGSLDHGLFQISDIYWCSPPGKGWVCGLSCAQLENSDISDDVKCMQKIYDEHHRLSGNGFNAWSVYKPHCKHNVDHFIAGCFESDESNEVILPMHKPGVIAPEKIGKTSLTKKIAGDSGKVYNRCELAKELRYKHNIPKEQVHTWVCIAQTLSGLSTAFEAPKNADGTSSHGIFQINDQFWCDINGAGKGCNADCSDLRDSDITDDVQCVRKIFNEHERIFGNGFQAWAPYENHCKYETPNSLSDCFDNEISNNLEIPEKSRTLTASAKMSVGKVFTRCELAKELRYKHNIPKEQIPTWVCIAKTLSGLSTAFEPPKNGDGSSSHGLFQINDLFWCDVNGAGKGCNVACSDLRDSDITDDVQCVKKIFSEHGRIFGNGFQAWAPYENHCKYEMPDSMSDCYDAEIGGTLDLPPKPQIIAESPKTSVGKVFSRCELARELRFKQNIPKNQIHTWVCIAHILSDFKTAFETPKNADGSSSHGLFQINDQFWCDVNGAGKGCNVACSDLQDDDISDDVRCAKQIYGEHQRIFGDGFQAWTVYENHCKYVTPEFVTDCYDDETSNDILSAPYNHNVFLSGMKMKSPKESPKIPSTVGQKSGKVYERCELAREMRNMHNMPMDQLHTWICIAQHESQFHTGAVGQLNLDGSKDHGLFQISDIYWCSNEGVGKGCNAACSDFRNNDISDDVKCVKQIYDEHQRLFNNGFNAWTVYEPHCRHQTHQFISDCFPGELQVAPVHATQKPSISVISNAVGDQGRGYERCELAKELRYRHNVPQEQVADWVCIALYSSNLATSAKGPNSHGLFQINNEFWCSNSGVTGKKCNLECSQLEDSDITDDYQCAQLIYDTHQKLYGDGFSAWNVYEPYCKGRSTSIIAGCFDDIPLTDAHKPPTPNHNLNVNYADNQITNSIGFGETETKGKVYDRCELAREMRYKHNMPMDHIHTWVCIVQRESNYDTSAIGRLNADGSLDHGLFQISDIYWCSNYGPGKACGVACSKFRDADISDDVQCITRIFDEHQRLFGNGFHAWTTYEPYCKQTTSAYTDDCFAEFEKVENVTKISSPTFVPAIESTTPNTVAATLTPINQFKYTTNAPLSLVAPTQPMKKYPTATAQFVSYYTTSTTQRPSFAALSQITTTTTAKPTTAPAKSFVPTYPTFDIDTTTPISIVPVETTTTLKPFSLNIPPLKLQTTTPIPNALIQTKTTTRITPFSFSYPSFKFEKTTPISVVPFHTKTTSLPSLNFPSINFQSSTPSIDVKTPQHSLSNSINIPSYRIRTTTPVPKVAITTKPHKVNAVHIPSISQQALPIPFAQSATKTSTTAKPIYPTFAPLKFHTTTQSMVRQPMYSSELSTSTSSPKKESTKFNLFNFYLSGYTTKQPQRYNIPSFAPAKHITPPNPYTVRTSTTPSTFSRNSYSIPDYFKSNAATTKKPSPQQVQRMFESQISKFANTLGLNATQITQKPRVWRYSFSGIKSQSSQQ